MIEIVCNQVCLTILVCVKLKNKENFSIMSSQLSKKAGGFNVILPGRGQVAMNNKE